MKSHLLDTFFLPRETHPKFVNCLKNQYFRKLLQDPSFAADDTICAFSTMNGASICKGDAGGGLTVETNDTVTSRMEEMPTADDPRTYGKDILS